MDRKMITGWLVLCLGISMIGSGWILAARGAQASTEVEPMVALTATLPQEDSQAEQHLADEGLIRVHVIAHSDEAADQALKLHVRDAVLAALEPRLTALRSTPEVELAIVDSLTILEEEAAQVIEQRGFAYGVRAELGHFDFPGKSYGSLYLPAGRYKALRIIIGAGEGANFWCLVYPSFCYTIRETQLSHAKGEGQQGGPVPSTSATSSNRSTRSPQPVAASSGAALLATPTPAPTPIGPPVLFAAEPPATQSAPPPTKPTQPTQSSKSASSAQSIPSVHAASTPPTSTSSAPRNTSIKSPQSTSGSTDTWRSNLTCPMLLPW